MKFLSWHKLPLLPLLFATLLMIVVLGLLSIEQPLIAQGGYIAFALLTISAYLTQQSLPKHTLVVIAVVLIVAIGFIYPLDIEALEEIYLFIPFLFLIIYPGTWIPFIIGLLLITGYLPSYEKTELEDFLEDAIEMVVISGFATTMTYFQQKSYRQMNDFRHESMTDYLTRLPNRKKFMEHMEALHHHHFFGSRNQQFALLIIDLDGFKKINDQLGHLSGDQVLKMVANRLNKLTSNQCHAFRIGGDEFAIIVSCTDHLRENASKVASQVLALSESPYIINGKNYFISSSIGISIYPDEGKDIEQICTNADLAMYASKSQGKDCFSFFETELMTQTVRKYELDSDLKQAITNNELFLVYQPKVCLKTGVVNSAEVLLRWNHPKYGSISPAEFIPIAEESHAIIDIGNWVLKQSCLQLVQWKKTLDIERLSVNVSSVQLSDPNFIKDIYHILAVTECKPEWIEIEQTESWIMENPDENVRILSELKSIGLYLSLDDFGTAYSSLSQVGRLPIDVLKIDRSFVNCCVENTSDHMIIRTIIQLGQNLNMKIIAEGVETEEQKHLLYSEGCDFYQGFLFSKPVPSEVFEHGIMNPVSANKIG